MITTRQNHKTRMNWHGEMGIFHHMPITGPWPLTVCSRL